MIIPDDIRLASEDIVERIARVHQWRGNAVSDIASAILRERDRCARVAREFVDNEFSDKTFVIPVAYASEAIALEIEYPSAAHKTTE